MYNVLYVFSDVSTQKYSKLHEKVFGFLFKLYVRLFGAQEDRTEFSEGQEVIDLRMAELRFEWPWENLKRQKCASTFWRERFRLSERGGTRGLILGPFRRRGSRGDFQVTVMINHHGVAGSDDPDESPDAAAYDDRGQFLAQNRRHHPGAFRQDSESCETAWGVHGSDPGTEMLPWFTQINVQVCQHFLSYSSRKFFKKVLQFVVYWENCIIKKLNINLHLQIA